MVSLISIICSLVQENKWGIAFIASCDFTGLHHILLKLSLVLTEECLSFKSCSLFLLTSTSSSELLLLILKCFERRWPGLHAELELFFFFLFLCGNDCSFPVLYSFVRVLILPLFVWDYVYLILWSVTVYCNHKVLLVNSNGQVKLFHFMWKITYFCVHAWKFIQMSFIHTYIKLFDSVMSNSRVQLRLFCSSPEQALIFTSLNNLIYQPSYLLLSY